MLMEVLSYKIGKIEKGSFLIEIVDSSGNNRMLEKVFKTYTKAKYWCLNNLNVRQG